MGLRYITVDRVNDPVQIYAKDDAKIYHSLLGASGIIPNEELGNLELNVVSKDATGYTIEIGSGVISLQGRIAFIAPNDSTQVRCSGESGDSLPRNDGLYLRFKSDSNSDESMEFVILKNNASASLQPTFHGGASRTYDLKIADIKVESATDITIEYVDGIMLSSLDSVVKNAKQEISDAVNGVVQVVNKVNKVIKDTNGNIEANNAKVTGSMEVTSSLSTGKLDVNYGPTQLNGAVNASSTMDVAGTFTNNQKVIIRHNQLNVAREMFKIAKKPDGLDESYAFTIGYDSTNKLVIKHKGHTFMTLDDDFVINQLLKLANGAIITGETQFNGAVNASSMINAGGTISSEQAFHSNYGTYNQTHAFFKATQGDNTNAEFTLSHVNGTDKPTLQAKYRNNPIFTIGDDFAFNKKVYAYGGLDATGDIKASGNISASNIQSGTSMITSKVNEVVTQSVTFSKAFSTVPNVTISAMGSVPGELKALTISDITKTGFKYHLLKSSAYSTTLQWIAIAT